MKKSNLTLKEKVALKELKIEIYKRVLSILESAKKDLLIRKYQAMRLSIGQEVVEPQQGVIDWTQWLFSGDCD